MSLLEIGRHPMTLFTISLCTRKSTPYSCLSSFPLKYPLRPPSVWISPDFFHLISHNPRMLHLYRSITCKSSSTLPAALRVLTMLHTNFQGHRPFVSREDDFFFLGIYHLWAWRPSWSYDLDHWSNFRSPIWLQSAKQFLRKRNLKMLNLRDLGPRSMNDLDHWYSYRFI